MLLRHPWPDVQGKEHLPSFSISFFFGHIKIASPLDLQSQTPQFLLKAMI